MPEAPRFTPGPFDDAFLADLPYDPSVLFIDELLEVDPAAKRVRCRMRTDKPLPLTDQQRADPLRHPRHVAGGLMVHVTGMLGFVHAYHLLGLRHADGWVGYGTHIHEVVFRKLVSPGAPLDLSCTAVRARLGKTKHFVRYRFEFTQEGEMAYEGEQSAFWVNVLG